MRSTSSSKQLDQLAPKLESLGRCLERIESKLPLTQDKLRGDADVQDVVTLNLERAVHQCVDSAMMLLAAKNQRLPGAMAETFTGLAEAGVITAPTAERMRKAVAFRNVAVHEYTSLDLEIVAAIRTHHLGDFRAFAREVIAHCEAAGWREPELQEHE